MNPFPSSHKRAEEFDLLLSASAARGSAAAGSPGRYDDLLELVGALRETSPPEPRRQFALDLRARLMVAAESALAPESAEQSSARRTPVVRRSARERRLAAAVGGFAVVSATASMAVAAQSALPGDTLYPLKRAIENAQAGVQRDADGKGATLLDNAAVRLDEIGALSESGDDDARAISSTLDDFVAQATEASEVLLADYDSTGRAASIEQLRTFTADSMGALTGLQSVVPRAAREALIEATELINAIDVQAQGLCPTCTDLPILAAPVFAAKSIDTLLTDALGPALDPLLPPPDSSPADPADPVEPDRSGAPDKGAGGSAGPVDAQPPAQPAIPGAEPPVAPGLPSAPPAQPQVPSGPTDPGGGGSRGDGPKSGGGPLSDLNINVPDGPLEDLLTGVGDGLGGAVDGLTDGLGGLGGALGGGKS